MNDGPIVICVGTRPEAIKMAPVVLALRSRGIPHLLVSSGQHREMLDQALDVFGLVPDVELALMRDRQGLSDLTARALTALDATISRVGPAAVLVQGDTATALAGALAAFNRQVPVGHVEAGLRTDDLQNPFPEEGNRRLIGRLAAWHFCPTTVGAQNLLRENVSADSIFITGNTVIDAALLTADRLAPPMPRRDGRQEVLVTMHRRESQGQTQHEISEALRHLADRHDVHLTFPVHLSPNVRASVLPALADHPNVTLSEPLDYRAMISCLTQAHLVITDSGGLQEEAPAFNTPVIVMRETTERPEGIDAGCSILAGTDPEQILSHAHGLLDDAHAYQRMAHAQNPYGDGRAAQRILSAMKLDELAAV